MNESTSSGINTDNSICSKETVNTSTSFEMDNPIPDDIKKYILKSISRNLKEIIKENKQSGLMKYVLNDIFYLGHLPGISLEDYIKRIYNSTKMNISTLIMSIIYIDRFCEYENYVISMNNIHKLLLSACLLSIKFNEDISISSKYYSEIAGIPVYDLNNLEFYLCVKLRFSLYVDYNLYQKYFEYFCKSEKKGVEQEKINEKNKMINKKDK